MASLLSQAAESARALRTAGRLDEARDAYLAALEAPQDAEDTDGMVALHRAILLLGFADLSTEQRLWPQLRGKSLDEILLEAAEEAKAAKVRSRALEGQLLFARSRLLFEKPSADSADMDAAIAARQEASELLRDAAVEALGWKASKVESQLAKAKAEDGHEAPLTVEQLLAALQRCGARAADGEHVEELFEAWAQPGAQGVAISLLDFLERVLETMQRIGSSSSTASCSAPCEGGMPSDATDMEKELVALVSRSGAGDWETKATALQVKFPGVTGASLESAWHEIAPRIKKVVDGDEPMSCGHKCSTCPTRHDCQVHDALKDIEDL